MDGDRDGDLKAWKMTACHAMQGREEEGREIYKKRRKKKKNDNY